MVAPGLLVSVLLGLELIVVQAVIRGYTSAEPPYCDDSISSSQNYHMLACDCTESSSKF